MTSNCRVLTEHGKGSNDGNGPDYHHHPILDHQLNTLSFGYPTSAPQSKDGDQSWTSIFPIGKDCGVNLQTPVFEFGKDDSRREYQVGWEVQVERERSHSQKGRIRELKRERSTIGYLSPSLTAIVTKSFGVGNEEEHAMFVIGLCTCKACIKKKVNTLEVEPMEVTLKLGYFKDLARKVLLSFFPGVTNNFEMRENAKLCRRNHLVYYSSFLPISALNIYPFIGESGTSYVFRDRREGEASRFMSKWTPSVVDITKIVGMKPLHYDEGMKMAKPDMELVSSEGKRFPCHQSVLSVQSPVFEEKLLPILMQNAEIQTRPKRKRKELVKFELSENSVVTEAFIKCLYNRDVLLSSLDLEDTVGVLQLASQYQLMNLLGTVSTLVMEKLEKLESAGVIQDIALLSRIHEVVEANSTIQIVFQLKEKFVNAAQRLLQPKRSKRIKLSEVVKNVGVDGFLVELDTKNVLQDLRQLQVAAININ